MSDESRERTGAAESGWGRAAAWLERSAGWVVAAVVVVTILLLIPLVVMEARPIAAQNPPGEVFDLQEEIDATFASPVHAMSYVAEARDGDVLTQAVLSELLGNQRALQAADARGELTPEGAPKQSFLFSYFDVFTNLPADGVTSLADAVDAALGAAPGPGATLAEATDEQVKVALHRLFSSPETEGLRDILSSRRSKERRIVGGEEIDWWASPALITNVIADNEKLGGGTLSISVGADEATQDKEEFNRSVQEFLRGDERTYELWGIAIDLNLESNDEGQVAGIFIMFTVIGAVAVVGLTLRSYWATALTGAGLAILMIWLKGISVLVGIKGGLVVDMIVPIAMVSLGVDFAIHAVRRYREEGGPGVAPGRALAVGMGGVLGALVLALFSDSVAFLSNTAAGIEAVVHFGLAAAIAVVSAFVVLGVAVPAALMRVDTVQGAGRGPGTVRGRALSLVNGAGVAALAGTSVVLVIAVSVPLGAAVLAALVAVNLAIPYAVLLRRRRRSAGGGGTAEASAPSGSAGEEERRPGAVSEVFARVARFRYVTLPASAAITVVAVVFALRLEATFDAKDFLDSGSDFVVSLDKLDEHYGQAGGEPATVFVEGDLTVPAAIAGVQGMMDAMQGNPYLARGSDGLVVVSEPNVVSILREMTASRFARGQVEAATGVAITDADGDGLPDSQDQIRGALGYAVTGGVPRDAETLLYGPDRVQVALSHDPAGGGPDAMVLSVFLPGTREQSTVLAARDAILDDMGALEGVPGIERVGLTGSPLARREQLQATVDSMQISIPIAAAGAFVLLLLAMRSVRFAVVTIVPIGLVVAWLYGLMQVSGFGLNFVTATIGAVSIGVGIDYSIHMTERFREELGRARSREDALRRALDGTGVALVASALSSIVGFAIMGFAPMPMFATYGMLTAIMIFLALAASLAVLPSLLMLVTREPGPGAGASAG